MIGALEAMTASTEKAAEALEIMAGIVQKQRIEIDRLRAALDILQAAMTEKKPISMRFKKAIIDARSAVGGNNG